jgi:hypothetical protein
MNRSLIGILILLLAFSRSGLADTKSTDEDNSVAAVEEGDEDDEEEDGDEEEGAAGVAGTALSASASRPEAGGWGGWLDVRPSWTGSASTFHSENELGIEYRFRSDRAAGYTQEFRSNWLRAGVESDTNGFEFQLWYGYFWGDVSDIAEAAGGAVTLSWEPRLYLPTLSTERESGLVLSTRQYLKLNWEVSSMLSFFLWDAPIGYVYTAAGVADDEGGAANPAFENRIELGARLSFFDGQLSFKLPVILQSVRYRKFAADAENDDSWANTLWIYPEVAVQVTEGTSLGLAFYSDALTDVALTKSEFSEGMRKGVAQFVLTQAL